MEISEIWTELLGALLGLIGGVVVGITTTRSKAKADLRVAIREQQHGAALEKRQLAYLAARQWARAVTNGSQVQVLTAKLGQSPPEYEPFSQPDPEVWDLYASTPVQKAQQEFWATAQLLHGTAGRVRANSELISKLAELENQHSDSGAPTELLRSQDQLTAALDVHVARLHETEQAMREAMRQDLLGAS
jgi:hypothetical protein